MKRHVLLLGFLSLAWAAGADDAPPRAAPGPGVPRGERLAWKTVEGVEYEYTVPKSYQPERSATLLLLLHGSNLDRRWSFANFAIGTFRRDDIIVSPDGTTSNGQGGFNFLGDRGDADKLAALIRAFQKTLKVERVYLYGHSQGAFFCFYFAGEYPELVDALCPHAGGLWIGTKIPRDLQDKPIAILHARADAVVPLANSEGARDHLQKQGLRHVTLEILEDATAESGHWPRPDKTEPLLAWCDSLTASTPHSQLTSAAAQVTGAQPALARAMELVKRARAGAAKLKKEDKEGVEAKAKAIDEAIDAFGAAHVAALTPAMPPKGPVTYGDWTLHFLTAQRWCEGTAKWKAFEKALAADQAKHERIAQPLAVAMDQATKAESTVDACHIALRITRDAWLSRDHARAASNLLRTWADAAPAGVGAAAWKAYQDEAARRTAADAVAQKRCDDARAAALAALREQHPEWFPPGEDQ